jgi:alpha-beta hydrolase superfamily lysophospholipase
VPRRPLVLVHGYSDRAESFDPWVRALTARGYDVAAVHVCSYRSLTNEVTIRDVAEGFDRALRMRTGLNADEEFDAIVHSTGMLVLRAWLTGSKLRVHYDNPATRALMKPEAQWEVEEGYKLSAFDLAAASEVRNAW